LAAADLSSLQFYRCHRCVCLLCLPQDILLMLLQCLLLPDGRYLAALLFGYCTAPSIRTQQLPAYSAAQKMHWALKLLPVLSLLLLLCCRATA
jgi:hypothetical protein